VVISVPTGAQHDRVLSNKKDCWILHERARHYAWKGTGGLSIKAFFGGRAHYEVGCAHHAVDERSYLVLNEGQTYAISIESPQPVESFCLFFAPGFAEEVRRSLSLKAERLLDEPNAGDLAPIHFFEKNYAQDSVLTPALRQLKQNYATAEKGGLVEELHAIVERLLKVHEIARRESNRLQALRRATRDELYRRLCRARDYANAFFAQPITLADLARVACLSPNHLLRAFRQVFGETPHQFLTRSRLEEACRLLAQSEARVTDVCLEVGFESHGSFSALFHRRFGVSPTQYRQSKR